MTDTRRIKQFNRYVDLLGGKPLDAPPTREDIHQMIFADMMNRTSQMFEYDGLPDTIPQRDLELMTQLNGYTFIDKVNDDLYAFTGGLGGESESAYYEPTLITISNPALRYNATRRIDIDGALIRNDSLMYGMREINDLYAWYMTEAFLTLRMALINARSEYIINVTDDSSDKGADAFIKSLVNGDLSFTKTVGFDESLAINTLPYSQHAMENIKSAIEAIQYLQGSWFRKIGLVQVFNMKREYVSEGETEMSEDSLDSLPIDMLDCRKRGVEMINKLFGTHITVRLGKAWRVNTIMEDQKEDKEDIEDEDNRAV